MHGLDPAKDMVIIEPDTPPKTSPLPAGARPLPPQTMSTAHILSVIDRHAAETALVFLPGIQYYTGQLLDMAAITAHARARGIPAVAWDLAHAVGNVELRLHAWQVDFAVWCNYKYVNAGPGAIGGLFVHEKHGRVERLRAGAAGDAGGSSGGSGVGGDGGRGGSGGGDATAVVTAAPTKDGSDANADGNGDASPTSSVYSYRPRLAGWWGGDKSVRFRMDNRECCSLPSSPPPISHPLTLVSTPRSDRAETLKPIKKLTHAPSPSFFLHLSRLHPHVRRSGLPAVEPVGARPGRAAGLSGRLRADGHGAPARQVAAPDGLPRVPADAACARVRLLG